LISFADRFKRPQAGSFAAASTKPPGDTFKLWVLYVV
jgi:hypothetical protein